MIRHLVLARVRADVPAEEVEAVLTELAGLQTLLPGMRGFVAGRNVSPEGLARGFGHAFTCDFDDAAARDAYLDHPAHRAAGARLVAALDGGLDGLLVLDIDIDIDIDIDLESGPATGARA